MTAWLTVEDEQNYGRELLDVSQRAALHAVAPHLQEIERQNAELQRRLAIEARRNLDARVERAVPNFREVDRDPRWLHWLAGTDALTGRPRQVLLNDAIASTDANRVAEFFRKFQQEAGTQTASASAPTYSGRTRSSGKQVYTRDDVKRLYRMHQQGAYAGREAEWAKQEVDIIRAGAEGRILGGTDVAGK
jgi:hypothetical protein